jgi:hypothetical protein
MLFQQGQGMGFGFIPLPFPRPGGVVLILIEMLEGLYRLFDLPILDIGALRNFFQIEEHISGGTRGQRSFHGFGKTFGPFDQPISLLGVNAQLNQLSEKELPKAARPVFVFSLDTVHDASLYTS